MGRLVEAIIENHSERYPACDDFGVAHLRFTSGVGGTVEAPAPENPPNRVDRLVAILGGEISAG